MEIVLLLRAPPPNRVAKEGSEKKAPRFSFLWKRDPKVVKSTLPPEGGIRIHVKYSQNSGQES
jgi:hypothetical protein